MVNKLPTINSIVKVPVTGGFHHARIQSVRFCPSGDIYATAKIERSFIKGVIVTPDDNKVIIVPIHKVDISLEGYRNHYDYS